MMRIDLASASSRDLGLIPGLYMRTSGDSTNETYVENIENTTNEVVDEKEGHFQTVVQATTEEHNVEMDAIIVVQENVDTLTEEVGQVEESITPVETEIEETCTNAEIKEDDFVNAVGKSYDVMGENSDFSIEFSDNHNLEDCEDVFNPYLSAYEDTQVDLTATCDKAKEDYTTLKNAVEQYGKDYDEEAYNKAIEGITIPVINLEETNQASEALIAKLEEYDDTAEWITSIRDYQKTVEELNNLNMEAMFNELYATKDKYDELKSMKAELEAKKEELANKQAELDQMYETLKANDAIRAEEIAQAKAELDKAIAVQQNVLAGIYEKVDDPAYAEYNKSIDAYYSSLVETPKDEEQTSPKEEEVVVIPEPEQKEIIQQVSAEKPVYTEIQTSNDHVPTASYSGLTGYAMSAMMALVCVGVVAKKRILNK